MGTHEHFDREHRLKTSSDRAFGVVFTAVFVVIGLFPLVGGGAVRWWALIVAAVIAALAALAPGVLAPANRAWTRLGLVLHRIVNPIVTGLLFFAVVTPTGLIMRAFGKDPLRLEWDREAKSYWIERRPPGPAPETMSNQF